MELKKIDDKLSQLRRDSEERDAKRRAEKLDLKYLDLTATPVVIEALATVPEEKAHAAKLAVIEKKRNALAAAVFDSRLKETAQILEELKKQGNEVKVFVVSQSSLNHAFDFYKYVSEAGETITGKVAIEEKEIAAQAEKISSLAGLAEALNLQKFETYSAAQVFELVLAGALKNRASDIHLEPEEKKAKLRLRIDGLLHDVFILKKKFYPFLISRIKLLSGLKLNVTDKPQDGRFTINLMGKEIEVRVAVAPSEFGEVVVMRLLDPDSINLELKDLGLRQDDLDIIEAELKRPNGLILNTGPTGSGKTTTLYSFLRHKLSPEVKIITIENPIEYHIEGLEQTQVDEEAGYTFAGGLRSLMRQDPDIILVGEIRDGETAGIGIQAALTGHLVFSTIHANEAAGAVPRLLDLGVKPESIGPALNLVIGQRLVRRLCQNCKIKDSDAEQKLKEKIAAFLAKLPPRISKSDYAKIEIFKPAEKGCEKCNGMGYKGRVAVYELLKIVPEIEELISKSSGALAIQKFALGQGMTTMQQDGILKVISGLTTFDEVEGVTGPIEWTES